MLRTKMKRNVAMILGAALILGSQITAQNDAEAARGRQVLHAVASLLNRGHVSALPLDDAVSSRALSAYLEALDPLKLYFTERDDQRLARFANRLDDMVRHGDSSFAQAVFDLLLKRVDERVEWAEQILAGELDFSIEESFVTDPERVVRAEDDEEARGLWRRRVKYDILTAMSGGLSEEKARERVDRRYRRFRDRMHRTSSDERLALFVNALGAAYDPHSTWLAPEVLEEFQIAMRLNYQGIGAHLADEDGHAVIKSLIPGGAAAQDGDLGAGDRIVKVGQGDSGPMEEVVGLPLSDVVKLIRGEEGTVVRLGILPAGGSALRVHRLVRSRLELSDGGARSEILEKDLGDGRSLEIGIIDLPGFYADTAAAQAGRRDFRSSSRDLRRILGEFREAGVDAVVVDLRRNGGGLLSEAVEVTGLFIDRGPVVTVKGAGDRARTLQDRERGVAWHGPLVVLTSQLSASASEIFAGAIQDYGRGLVVGDRQTHGKGTVQEMIPLGPSGPGGSDLGMFKLTIQKFYRPSGKSTQMRGVAADVVLPSVIGAMEIGEDELPNALPFDQIRPSRHGSWKCVDARMVETLQRTSADRRAASPFFTELNERVKRARRIETEGRIPLKREAFLALHKKEKNTAEDAAAPSPSSGIDRDGYLEEVLAITADYAHLLSRRLDLVARHPR